MSKRAVRVGLCLLTLLTVPLALLLSAFALPPQYEQTFLGGFSGKVDALRAAPGRRIVLAGGSGAAFAVRSDLLEEELPGYHVVNLGMYAGLGSTVPLEAARALLREGDVVVFLPEQSEQTLSMYFGSEAMWQAADGDWRLLGAVRRENWRAMLGQFPYFAAHKAGCFLRGEPARGDGVYARDAFNRWGDIESALRERNVMPDGCDPSGNISFSDALPTPEFIDYVNEYGAMCAGRGVEFYFGFCPMNASALEGVPAQDMERYEERLSGALEVPVLGSVRESALEPCWFFDTNFHLNSAGAIAYTARLAAQLKRALGVDGEVSIPLPEPPGAAAAEAFSGDDSCAAYFQYTKAADGWRVSGVTEAGARMARLVVPTHYQGEPVTGFTATAFAGNAALEALTLQPNIRAIADGSFDGCTRLKKLILRGVSPSECTVGAELLRGTEALVYVDAPLLARYQTNYFWAVHATRIRAAEAESGAPSPTPAPAPTALPAEPSVCYDANGGRRPDAPDEDRLYAPIDGAHLRMNALQCSFERPGYVLIAWNTRRDGSGASIGLGSRFSAEAGMTLYAQWAAESPSGDFSWALEDGGAWITGYRGSGAMCVVPASIDGATVRGIRSGAFTDAAFDVLVLPPGLAVVEPGAFVRCALRELYLSDALEEISDASFADCPRLATLHVNAATAPVYSISYYATFADKYDRLLSLAGHKKLVLFSGSSTRYGYDSAALQRAYPEYGVANMGVYAYTNALPQMELILTCMEPGDVLLHAPELDTLHNQSCEENSLDHHFWAMMEANYDCVSQLDLRAYTGAFDSFHEYLSVRRELPGRSYQDSPNGYNDDGDDCHAPTYNEYGDFIMLRDNTKIDMMLQHVRAVYTVESFPDWRIEALNREYRRFADRGVRVLFTYTPRNRSSLSEDSTPQNRAALDALLRRELCVPVISGMEDSLMSGVYFYLIDSHLSTEGVRLHTQQIIRDLAPYL